jgi:uncharacterized membrane protein YebE (DUF533 family)
MRGKSITTLATTFATVATAAFLALPASAQTGTGTPNIDQRQQNQQQRIDQGVQSGSLTAPEANRLQRGETHIQTMEDKAKSDGQVTTRERARLEHAENKESTRIYRQKHDRQHDFNHDGKNDRAERRQNRR